MSRSVFFFLHLIQSESLNIEYLPIESRFDTCSLLVLGVHFKYIKVIKINPMYTGMCRDFLRGRGSNVKKGHLSSLISNVTITINTIILRAVQRHLEGQVLKV